VVRLCPGTHCLNGKSSVGEVAIVTLLYKHLNLLTCSRVPHDSLLVLKLSLILMRKFYLLTPSGLASEFLGPGQTMIQLLSAESLQTYLNQLTLDID
jgi:hypothetical protein